MLLLTSVTVAGCATTNSAAGVRTDYIGATFSELQATFGDNYKILDVRGDYKRVRWVQQATVLAGGFTASRPKPITAGTKGTVFSSVPTLKLPETTTLPCIIDAVISPEGIVVGLQREGRGCL